MNRTIRAVITLVAAVSAASVTTVVVAAVDDGSAPASGSSSSAPSAAPKAAPAARVNPQLAKAFAVFRAPANVASRAHKAARGSASVYGVNHALDRSVQTDIGSVTVVPGSLGACIVVPDPARSDFRGATCASTDGVLRGQLVITERSRDLTAVTSYGMVPDGVDEVTLAGTSESRATAIDVENNIWAARPGDAKSVSYTDAAGKVVTTVLP